MKVLCINTLLVIILLISSGNSAPVQRTEGVHYVQLLIRVLITQTAIQIIFIGAIVCFFIYICSKKRRSKEDQGLQQLVVIRPGDGSGRYANPHSLEPENTVLAALDVQEECTSDEVDEDIYNFSKLHDFLGEEIRELQTQWAEHLHH